MPAEGNPLSPGAPEAFGRCSFAVTQWSGGEFVRATCSQNMPELQPRAHSEAMRPFVHKWSTGGGLHGALEDIWATVSNHPQQLHPFLLES